MKSLIARVSLATMIVLTVALLAVTENGNSLETKERAMMKDTTVLTTGIPPIDAAAPAKTETATFALG